MESNNRIITLASFVYLDKVDSFKRYLYNRFKIKENSIFEYSYNEDDKKILTFIVNVREGEKVYTDSFYPPTIIVHKKGECFYTINALNKLIEKITDNKLGNINYRDVKIEWDDHQNKMMIIRNNELKILEISRVFS